MFIGLITMNILNILEVFKSMFNITLQTVMKKFNDSFRMGKIMVFFVKNHKIIREICLKYLKIYV